MPTGYAALPSQDHGDVDETSESSRVSHLNEEQEQFRIQASDDEDEDEEDEAKDAAESRPLNPNRTVSAETIMMPTVYPPTSIDNARRVSYDLAPPGSPPPTPRPDRAIPWNNLGNSNGIIPSSPAGPSRAASGWLARAAGALLPTHYAQRVMPNDGVFSNVTAKPSVPGQVAEDEDVHVMPEDAQKDTPPTYASASADAVPPYWEASSSSAFTASSVPSSVPIAAGDLIIDGIQTGVLFSFVWNLLVSVSFQFIGFLLTYIMHSTHAAKYGSRAGLGLTLVQYGFAMRSQGGTSLEGTDTGSGDRMVWTDGATGFTGTVPLFDSAGEADAWGAAHPNVTLGLASDFSAGDAGSGMSEFATDVIAFMLMTMGWFLLLTSFLGYYRVKRTEKAILAANQPVATVYPGSSSSAANNGGRDRDDPTVLGRFERAFAWRSVGITADVFRQGLGFRTRRERMEEELEGRDRDQQQPTATVSAAAEELGRHVDWHEVSLNSGGRSIFVNHRFNDLRASRRNGEDHVDDDDDDGDDGDDNSEAGEGDAMMPQAYNADGTPLSPEEMQRVLTLLRDEERLRRELTAAGLL